ncbi:MAG TPA: hypothetical protein DDY13_04860 [Cytophagales bacterium]|jgi:hypothetical protein|nr:hypothetical protein [Cytophagales bacterium]
MHRSLLLILCPVFIFTSFIAHSQDIIRTKNEATAKPSYGFSGEWQYLTTDIYLFNETRFNNLINNLERSPNKNIFGKITDEQVEMLTITARVKDVVNFNNQEVVYPLFNYKVDYGKDQKYKTQGFAGTEAIRMFDNLPLATTKNFINAVIDGTVITNTEGNKVMGLIAQQLQNIANFTNPSTAVFTIIGEMGKYLESSSRKKQYKFSSTIRLYDDAKFSKRLHSINVFSLRPSREMHKENFDAARLEAYVSLLEFEDQEPITYDQLKTLLPYDEYPFFVVVNYKSKYNPPAINEDRIDYEYIDEYKQRVNKDCEQGLNNAVVCKQEERLVEFLYDFANFKVLKQQYDLNLSSKLTDKLDKNLFILLEAYYELQMELNSRKREFATVPAFQNDFLPRYEKILQTSERYLTESSNLNQVRLAVDAMMDLQKLPQAQISVELAEKYAVLLSAVSLPSEVENSDANMNLKKWRNSLDKLIYEKKYMSMVDRLSGMKANEGTFKEYEKIKKEINNTACVICRQEMNEASAMYLHRYETFQLKRALKNALEAQNKAKDALTGYLGIKSCVTKKYEQQDSAFVREDYQFIYQDISKSFSQIDQLRQLVGNDLSLLSIDELNSYEISLQNLHEKIEMNIRENCERLPGFCECDE